ncbi:MAG: ABC transporter ATP-binding protein [Candidatus Eremiobacteraeota bacterium]|nr:ABC transporter ATP-binding protein [Candidatus Eremiobacteraeota bacterium]
MSLLEVDAVNTYYGDSHILFDVSMRVEEGEVVALLGRNGSGKTTTMMTVMGILTPRSGEVRFAGHTISGRQPYEIAGLGVQLVPDTRRIVKTITVQENLELAAFSAKSPWSLARIYETFPRLEQRKSFMGRSLSGGEQQMLAIARALIRDARVLLLDEPFEGLAPIIVRDLLETTKKLASEGRTILIVEQNVRAALLLAHRTYVLSKGHVVLEATPADLEARPDVMHRYLGV